MKICIINNLYPPYERGGAEVAAENQVNDFISQANDVFVITAGSLFKKINPSSPSKYKVYCFYPFNIFSFYYLNKFPVFLRAIWRLLDIFNLHSYFKIKKILKKEKPDSVYGHNLTGFGLLIPRLITKLKIRYVQTMHDVVAVRPSGLLIYGKEQENFLIKLWLSLNRWLYDSPSEVRFPSIWLKNFYEAHGFFKNSRKEIVRNFTLPTAKDLLTDKQLKSSAKVNLLYVGQIEGHKGILFLIQALNTLYLIHYTLYVIGSGSALSQAKRLAANNPNIKFIGWQPQEKIQEYFKQADYTIVPSLCYENSPTIIFESLKARVPVIASNLGGIPELVKNSLNGYLFKHGNKNELVFIIKNIFAGSRLRSGV